MRSWSPSIPKSAFAPPIRGTLEVEEEEKTLQDRVARFNQSFQARIECAVDADTRFWLSGRYTLLEAMNRLPEPLSWIQDGDRVRIVPAAQAIARWKKLLGD